ncbi:MAG TPA: ABC transporter permease [Anaeromyxobacteraceae bacterium]|nr:ABC transporter permease [Anaeromyxobacteraceae bacterium]
MPHPIIGELAIEAELGRNGGPGGGLGALRRRAVPLARRLAGWIGRGLESRPGVWATALVVPALLLAVWNVVAEAEWVSNLVLPPPALVLQSLRELWGDGTIQSNLAISALRVAKGFSVGASAGLVLGTALGLSARFQAYVQPTLMAVYQVNVMAWLPLLILVFGIDEPLKTAAIGYASALPITLNVAKGIAGIPVKWLELARVHRLSRLATVRRVALPATLPALFTGVRSGLGAAWTSLVVVELIASSEGVGFMVVWGRQLFQLDVVIVAIIVIGVVGLSLDLVLSTLERRLQLWHRSAF